MIDDVFPYLVTLPEGVNEVVFPCADGWTVWISDRLDDAARQRAYDHAVNHVKNGDFGKCSVQLIEGFAHEDRKTTLRVVSDPEDI